MAPACAAAAAAATPAAAASLICSGPVSPLPGRSRLRSGAVLPPVHIGDEEGQVQGLAAVEPGVARRLVAVVQVAFRHVLTAADALGHVVAGELDVDAARVGAERP